MNRTAFRERPHEDRLVRDGFVTLALLDQQQIASVREGVARLGFGRDDGSGFPIPRSRLRISITQGDAETSHQVFVELSPVLRAAASTVLQEYALLRIGVFDKLPGGIGIGAHQHATIVDEARYRSLTIWLPLTDTSVEMGTLYVVKGSHEFTRGFRPKNLVRDAFARVSQRTLERHSTPMLLRAGEAVVFDDRLLHWSPPNRSARIRTALQLELIPDEADLLMYYRTSPRSLVKYAVDRDVYRRNWLNREDPQRLTHLEKLSQPDLAYGNRQFVSMVSGARTASASDADPFFSKLFSGIRDRIGF